MATPTEEATPTENEDATDDEPDIDRPDNYRWDMQPGRNEELRRELGQYVEGSVGDVVETHPAFEYSTEPEDDDHTVDFEALKLFRDAQFDILKKHNTRGIPFERSVEAFVNQDIYEDAKTKYFQREEPEDPDRYTRERWLEAETFEESLDLAQGLLRGIILETVGLQRYGIAEQAATLREAYQRHHEFAAPLAWETNRGIQTGHDDWIIGLMHTPADDKIRAFNSFTPGSNGWHSEVQEWDVFDADGEFFHPLLFHTDEWNRQEPGPAEAKMEALATVFAIGTNEFGGFNRDATGILGNITVTTAGTKQLTRTLLEYNNLDEGVADFGAIWNLAAFAVGRFIADPTLKGVIDTVTDPDERYDDYFSGGFAFYEVDNPAVVEAVHRDRDGEYDHFGQRFEMVAEEMPTPTPPDGPGTPRE
jgi:hypothetical protein